MVPPTPKAAPPINPAATPNPKAFLEKPFLPEPYFPTPPPKLVPKFVPYPGVFAPYDFFPPKRKLPKLFLGFPKLEYWLVPNGFLLNPDFLPSALEPKTPAPAPSIPAPPAFPKDDLDPPVLGIKELEPKFEFDLPNPEL